MLFSRCIHRWCSQANTSLLASICFLCAVVSNAVAGGCLPGSCADTLILEVNIITADESRPRAKALAVRRGRIIAVGSVTEISPYAGEDTTVVTAEGQTLVPGFIDAHSHPMMAYTDFGTINLKPDKVEDLQGLISILSQRASVTPRGHWIIGFGYQDTSLGRHPTRSDLDRASNEHPIIIYHSSGHRAVVNSSAFELAMVTRDSPDPSGGHFEKNTAGELTGGVYEKAAMTFINILEMKSTVGPPLPQPTHEEEVVLLRNRLKEFVSLGITSVAELAGTSKALRLYQDVHSSGAPVRVFVFMLENYFESLRALGIQKGFGDDQLRIGGVKLFHGNSLSGRTTWLYQPYANRPDYFGTPPERTQQQLNHIVASVHNAGLQLAIHSNGDREIDMTLDALELALVARPRHDHRHRIEHASVVNEKILSRVKALELVLVPHSYVYEFGEMMEAYGESRWSMMHPNGSALRLGIPVAGNSDFPVSAADPLLRIQSMVTRKSHKGKIYGKEQRVTAEQAIIAWTMGGAFAQSEEADKGSISVGKLADFVLLSDDPTQVSPDDIASISVEKTFIAGKKVYDRRVHGDKYGW